MGSKLDPVPGAVQPFCPLPLSLIWDQDPLVPGPAEALPSTPLWTGDPAIVCAAQANHMLIPTAGVGGGKGSAAPVLQTWQH